MRLERIREEWLGSKSRTEDLLQTAQVSYEVAKRILGPRKRYRKRQLRLLAERDDRRTNAEKARAVASCQTISDRWKSGIGRTEDLLAEAGISRNTAKLYLGKRPKGVKRHRRNRRSNWLGPAFQDQDERRDRQAIGSLGQDAI
jgi:hypothetical protein